MKPVTIRFGLLCCVLGLAAGSYAVLSAQSSLTSQRYRVKGSATGRVFATAPSSPLILDQPNRIPLTLSNDSIHHIWVSLSYDAPDGTLRRPPHSSMQGKVLSDASGNEYINITPKRLGRLHADITVFFDDGLVDKADIDADVVLANRRPKKLVIAISDGNPGIVRPTLYLALSNSRYRIGGLFPRVYYDGDPDPIPIPAKEVQFRIISGTDNGPSISIDSSTGEVKAVHRGHALVITTFQGLRALTCVNVMQFPSDGSDRTVCRELIPPGITPLTAPFSPSSPQPRVTK